jgi:hypothetical protein
VTIQLPDGVYLRVPFEEYVEQDALGGTDKAKLWTHREGWWWQSAHNPFRGPRKSTPDQIFGTALHAMLLEGPAAYEGRFCVKPDKADYPDALTNEDSIRIALRQEGIALSGTSSFKVEDWRDAAEVYLPDRPVWANVMADFERRLIGRSAITAEDDFAIRAMRSIATMDTPENQEMRELLSVGSKFPILSEVSVIYTDDNGIRHRARFDKLLPIVTADLKSIREWEGRTLQSTLDGQIKMLGYDVQMADYHVARQAMNNMLLEGEHNLHGGAQEERTHLLATAAWNQTNRWSWAWVWFQKPTSAGAAPVLLPQREAWQGPYHMAGFRKRHVALELYKRCMRHFGPDVPWGRVEPVHWPDEGAEHRILLGDRDWGPHDPVAGEAEHFGYAQ